MYFPRIAVRRFTSKASQQYVPKHDEVQKRDIQKLTVGYKLRNETSISMAELWAIFKALQMAKELNILEPVILTDSAVACEILLRSKNSLRVMDVCGEILALSLELGAEFQWLPSHVGIQGNEIADKTAKDVLKWEQFEDVIENHVSYGDLVSMAKRELKLDFTSWYEKYSEEKGVLTYNFMSRIEERPWYHSRKMEAKYVKQINRIIANHAYTGKFLKMIKSKDSELCDDCNLIEDVSHIIFKCKKYEIQRNLCDIKNCDNIIDLKNLHKEKIYEILLKFLKMIDLKI